MALALAACADAGPSEPESSLSPFAEDYLNRALDIMEAASIKRYEIDWPSFREAALADAMGAQSPAETHAAIIAALERLGDNHSFFVPPGGQPQLLGSRSIAGSASDGAASGPAAVDPSVDLVVPGVGYLDVPAFSGGGPEGDLLAQSYHQLIESVDTLAAVCHWVVDIRGNTGGNMWPMIDGVGPLLGDTAIGFFIDPDSVVNSWFYSGGLAGFDDVVVAEIPSPYTLGIDLPFVAVLTDSLTASSGEAVAVAFRGRPGTRSFGAPTWGVSTANAGFQLNDGAVIFLTVTTMADRDGIMYGLEVVPDVLVPGGSKTGDPATDEVLAAALQWLSTQPCV